VEADWSCTLGDSTTASICTDLCGDGKVVVPQAGYCDDGGTTAGDGCDATCNVESGASCTLGDSTTPSVCGDVCGDGVVVGASAGY
jgi:cysteine-rich repeat protein